MLGAGAWRHSPGACLACTLLLFLPLFRPIPTRAQQLDLPEPRQVASGVLLYHLDSPALVDPAGPVSIWMLRLDPARWICRQRSPTTKSWASKPWPGWPSVTGRSPRRTPAFPAQRRPGWCHDDRRAARQRHEPAPRGDWHLERRARCQARIRAPSRHGDARAPEQQPPSNGGQAMATIPIDGIDTTRHSRSIDAVHPVVSPRYGHRERRSRMGHRPSARSTRPWSRIEMARRAFRRGFVLSFGGEPIPEPLLLLGGARVSGSTCRASRSKVSRNPGCSRKTS